MIRLLPGPIGVTAHEARDIARRLERGESVGEVAGGFVHLLPNFSTSHGPRDGWSLDVTHPDHGTVRVAILTDDEIA